MLKFKIIADPRVKLDLKEAMEFLKTRRQGLHLQFLADYKSSLKSLQINPFFEVRYNNIRCLPLEIFKYMIHFTVDENLFIVHVHAVISTYLNPENHWIN